MRKIYNFAIVKTDKNNFKVSQYFNDGLFIHYRIEDYYIIINLNIEELLYISNKYNLEILSFIKKDIDINHFTKELEYFFEDAFRDIPENIMNEINEINKEIALSKNKTLKHFYEQRGRINFLIEENRPMRLISDKTNNNYKKRFKYEKG